MSKRGGALRILARGLDNAAQLLPLLREVPAHNRHELAPTLDRVASEERFEVQLHLERSRVAILRSTRERTTANSVELFRNLGVDLTRRRFVSAGACWCRLEQESRLA